MNSLGDTLGRLSTQFGTGNSAFDITMFALIVGLLFATAAFLAWILTRKPNVDESRVDRFDTLLGRLERTERTIHEFRTDVLRSIELSRTDLEFVRGEIEAVRLLIEESSPGIQGRERRASREEIVSRLNRLPGYSRPLESQPGVLTNAGSNLELAKVRAAILENPEFAEGVPAPQGVRGKSSVDSGSTRNSGSSTVPSSGAVSSTGSSSSGATSTLATRLEKSRKGLFERFRGVFASRAKIDAETIDELETILVGSDLGVKNIREILADTKHDVANGMELSEGGVKAIVKSKLLALLQKGSPLAGIPSPRRNEEGPVVILIVGVNGAGKTTTAAKLAGKFKQDGSEVLLVAADTFRAAAVEQLHEWGRRVGVPVVSGAENAKPQTVVYDAMQRAMDVESDSPIDCVIIDTAGRLHTKQSLMDELTGIRNAIQKHIPNAPQEVLLVIDGSTGQNGLNQAREFQASAGVTGLVVTKLDGTSKGGIVVAIKEDLGIPVRYIGTGERVEDLEAFSPRDFVEALFAQ